MNSKWRSPSRKVWLLNPKAGKLQFGQFAILGGNSNGIGQKRSYTLGIPLLFFQLRVRIPMGEISFIGILLAYLITIRRTGPSPRGKRGSRALCGPQRSVVNHRCVGLTPFMRIPADRWQATVQCGSHPVFFAFDFSENFHIWWCRHVHILLPKELRLFLQCFSLPSAGSVPKFIVSSSHSSILT